MPRPSKTGTIRALTCHYWECAACKHWGIRITWAGASQALVNHRRSKCKKRTPRYPSPEDTDADPLTSLTES